MCKRPDMVYAVLARCPVFGGKVASFDATKTKAVPGVKDVVQISNGVAVIADNTWSAMQGRKVLDIKWDEGSERQSEQRRHHASMFAELSRASPATKSRARMATPPARWPRPRRKWKRCMKRRSYRTLPWSR